MSRRGFLLVSFFFVSFLVSILVFNKRIGLSVRKPIPDQNEARVQIFQDKNKKESPKPFRDRVIVRATSQPLLKPDDPKTYGIIVHKLGELPHNQSQWDLAIKKLFESNILKGADSKNIVRESLKSPQELNRRIEEINHRIEHYELMSLKNPTDEEVQKKLQSLYMVKSTLMTLEDQLFWKDEVPSF